MSGPRPDQKGRASQPLSPGGISIAQLSAEGLMTNATGLLINGHTQTTASNTGTALTQGVPPGVQNVASGSAILQGPGGGAGFFTFSGAGRIWAANVSYAMGSSGGTGSNQGYARVLIHGGATLCIVECCVVGNPSADSNTDSQTFPGFSVGSGTVIDLDVNNGTTISGVVQRASGLVVVSIP